MNNRYRLVDILLYSETRFTELWLGIIKILWGSAILFTHNLSLTTSTGATGISRHTWGVVLVLLGFILLSGALSKSIVWRFVALFPPAILWLFFGMISLRLGTIGWTFIFPFAGMYLWIYLRLILDRYRPLLGGTA